MNKESGYLVVITGASGAGKDEVTKKLIERDEKTRRIVTFTNRAIRKGEMNGVDYNFVSTLEFEKMIEQNYLAEYVVYRQDKNGNNEYKGTLRSDLENVLEGERVIWRIDPTRAAETKDFLRGSLGREKGGLVAEKSLVVYVGVEKLAVLKRRQLSRDGAKFSKEGFEKNLRNDWKNWLRFYGNYDLVVINRDGELDKAVDEIEREIGKLK